MPDTRDAEPLLPLRPILFHILLTLNEKELHGYAIMQDLRERDAGAGVVGPGTLYRVLKEMMDEGLIEHSPGRPEGEKADDRRRYYRLTPFGRQVASAEALRLARLVDRARGGDLLGQKAGR